jgi:Mlc titration factor MtfA (ptsG expression regulator)
VSPAWPWRRRNRRVPVDGKLWRELLASRAVLARLPDAEAELLRDRVGAFLAGKTLEGVRGLQLDEAMRLRIAAWACLPVLRLGVEWYDDWHNFFVSPSGFSDRRWRPEAGGVVTEWDDDLAGEVLELGPVVLSWDDVLDAGTGSGYNVVIHEMAHKLDARDGRLDGAPPLPREARGPWCEAFGEAWEDLCRRADRLERRGRLGRGGPGRGHGRLPLDDYACESPEEFFAVACENFFERPLGLKAAYPAVYGCLAGFFRLDPANWI